MTTVVGDVLESPPASGTEKNWLEVLVDDVSKELSRAKEWATHPVDETKRRAAEVLKRVEAMMADAKKAAEQYAPELLPKIETLAKDAALTLAGLGAFITAPFWLPLLLWLAYEVLK